MAISASGLNGAGAARLLLLLPNAVLIGLFLLAIAGIVTGSVQDRDGRFLLALYRSLAGGDEVLPLVWRTVRIAGLTTVTSALLSYPLASYIAASRRRNLLLVLVISPWLTSVIVRTFGWIVILGNRGVVNNALRDMGLVQAPLRMLFTAGGTVLGLVHVLMPFMVISILAVLVQLDRRLPEAGMSLGAGPVETFLRVTLPLSLPGVLSGCSLTYLLASGAIVTPVLLGGLRDTMLGTQIFQDIFATFDFQHAAALAMVLLATSLVVVVPIQLLDAWLRRHGGG